MKHIIYSYSKKDLINLVKTSKSLKDILKKMNVTVSNGINFKYLKEVLFHKKIKWDFSKFKRKYNHNVNENIFKTINSKDKAYWLGFIAADGYVPFESNRVTFELSIKDLDQLKRFIKFINGDLKALKYFTGNYNNSMVSFSCNNKIFSQNIKNKGIISPKSKKTYS